MISYLYQLPIFSRTVNGPTVNPSIAPSTTAATELSNEIIWIFQASGY